MSDNEITHEIIDATIESPQNYLDSACWNPLMKRPCMIRDS